MNQRNKFPSMLVRVLMLFALGLGWLPLRQNAAIPPAEAATSTLTLQVVSAADGAPITPFRYIINKDNTGTTGQRLDSQGNLPVACTPADPGYPDNCTWVSIAGTASSAPIFTQGDSGDFASGGISLPDGRYLVSVMADGYKLDGVHFTVPLADPGLVTVKMQPDGLPVGMIQAEVFEDVSPTNSAPDVPVERGLAGFVGHITDYIDFVTTDVFGAPLCGNGVCVSACYVVSDGQDVGTVAPVDPYGRCPIAFTTDEDPLLAANITQTLEGGPIPAGAVIEGKVKIPNLGPNRYALSVVAPDGTNWIQTTTLEGNHDWDAWVMEGATGLDTEFVVAGEPFPAIFFGYVPGPAAGQTSWRAPSFALGAGTITGVVAAYRTYVPAKGGVVGMEPMLGSAVDHVIDGPWLSLVDLTAGDTAVWIGQGGADGSFTIPNVPDGDYTLAFWDEPQDYILNILNVTVANGEVVDLGVMPLAGWWTTLYGHVFNDLNANGKMDPGEPGLANMPVAMKKRENSMMDRGAVAVTTDASGYYFMENAYPMTQWLVMEAYYNLYKTTGITYQADNQTTETTVLGAGVDVSVLPIIGLGGRLDWGVQPYGPNENGGIVGSVSYDTTRNELDPRYAAVENWQPGISNLPVYLYATVKCGTDPAASCDPTGKYQLAPDGSYAKGKLLNSYLSETWQRPTDCIARDVDGNPLVHGVDEQVLPTNPAAGCLEGPLQGIQFAPYATDQGTPAANFGATVDGNYGFGDACYDGTLDASDPSAPVCNGGAFTTLAPADYLVQVGIPTEGDVYGAAAVHPAKPLYEVTKEEDINIFNGDTFIPQVPPSLCAGALHTVDVAGAGTDNYPAQIVNGITVPASSPVSNPAFSGAGGSVFEGQATPLCDMKLVTLQNGESVAPGFNLFTDVPLPGRFWGLIVDDLNFSSDPRSLLYGEKAGVPFAPVGIYDYTNRLIYTAESDFNGLFDVLLPSTNRINCPTPSGVCANLYRFVGNDPGVPGSLNANYNPQFRTIAAEFEAFPGLIVPADLAPTQMGATTQLPGTQYNQPVMCTQDAAAPQLFAVSQPYADFRTSAANVTITLTGQGFGAAGGQALLDGTALATSAWSDSAITVTVPATAASGPHQLSIRAANGQKTVNGLTFHVLGYGAFPSTVVLDNFNRTGFGGNWNVSTNVFSLSSPTGGNTSTYNVRVRGTGTMRWGGSAGGGPSYSPNQEAYFTFYKASPTGGEQGLFLKVTGNGQNPDPTATSSAYIEVSYKATNPRSVQVRTKANGTNTVRLQATFSSGITFGQNDQLGARALADGTVIAYKNGTPIGSVNVTTTANPWPAAKATGGGRLGIRFVGPQNNATNDARFDNFGGGNITSYAPNLYLVGPGQAYATIQGAIDAAAGSAGDDLVVVFPGQPDPANPRVNPRGAYFENLVITTPIKLQGVGPGGVNTTTGITTPGSIVDGGGFAGDTAYATAWRTRVDALNWVGNQTVSEGEVVYLLAQPTSQFGSSFKAAIDGFDLRGGDQQGTPNFVTQGGAIFANAYIRNLQITNNVVENNNASYGTIRVGTPDLPAPETSQHNEGLRIANNRILANSGTNLAGAIGIFAGADNYEVANNDLCGNFSAEYGGGVSVYGYSPNGKIHDNRIYFNQSYDEGAGILIAGTLPANPAALSAGSGPVDVYNNLIQGNLANDDGGGLRFLMAGNYPMNVYNNMIVNNVSTHEGGGISLNDAPNVRIYNNTIMKNITTATALTSSGYPAPAGLSTSAISMMMQQAYPSLPAFSNPLLFNNIFWDNRAGTRGAGTVTGLSDADAYHWDLGAADGSGVMAPVFSIIQAGDGAGANLNGDPLVVLSYNTGVAFAPWRTNPNFIGAIMVTVNAPPTLLGNYHLGGLSPALNVGAPSMSVPAYQQPPATLNAPAVDIDNQPRPIGAIDIGADEAQ